MIVSTAIDTPKLKPDDWDKWWAIWNEHARPLTKRGVSPNQQSGLHFGFDVLKHERFNPVYQAVLVDLEQLYPSLYEQLFPFDFDPVCIRFVMSKGDFPAHMDNFEQNWSIRNMFYNSDPNPQWYYKSEDGRSSWLKLPEQTNWWAYLDGVVKHGTIYRPEHEKIIIQYFARLSDSKKLAEANIGKFPECQVSF